MDDLVVVETPGYPNTLASLLRTGARLSGTTVDPDGWDADAVRATIRQVAPRRRVRPRAVVRLPQRRPPGERRRARHVLTEMDRVDAAVAALERGEHAALAQASYLVGCHATAEALVVDTALLRSWPLPVHDNGDKFARGTTVVIGGSPRSSSVGSGAQNWTDGVELIFEADVNDRLQFTTGVNWFGLLCLEAGGVACR